MEFEEYKPKETKPIFGGKKHQNRDNTNLTLGLVVVLLVVIIVLSLAFNLIPLKNPFGGLSGNLVSEPGGDAEVLDSTKTPVADVKTIKDLKVDGEIVVEAFEIPVDNLDMVVVAQELQIITPTTDITVKLDKPVTFEAFNGRLYWKDSMFILEGKLGKYLSEIVNVNWKTTEDVKIKINNGSVEISQISIPLFESVASGKLALTNKVTLAPEKDSMRLDHYRGYFKALISADETKVVLDGTAEDMWLGNEQFNFNVE